MWQFQNPVRVRFGTGSFDTLDDVLRRRRYALVSYGEPPFDALRERLRERAGPPAIEITDIAPNPDMATLAEQSARITAMAQMPEVIVAVGGGSVIDSAKVFAASARHGFAAIRDALVSGDPLHPGQALPLVAVPTTAGTGSEVTPWGTVWDKKEGKKYSLASPALFPEWAIVDPELTLSLPRDLTISTALDALSHALESIWNRNANPVSSRFAIAATREILDALPALVNDLENVALRSRIAQAALHAGFAFSNTKTAIAHSLSYPITLRHGLVHGIACSFTLPLIMRSLAGRNDGCEAALAEIFCGGAAAGADRLEAFLNGLGVATDPFAYGISALDWEDLLDGALHHERGQNFIGSGDSILMQLRAAGQA